MFTKDSNTVALLHFNNSVNDECNNNWNIHGNNLIYTIYNNEMGCCIFFDGNTHLSSNNLLSENDDFTIEFRFLIPSDISINIGTIHSIMYLFQCYNSIYSSNFQDNNNSWFSIQIYQYNNQYRGKLFNYNSTIGSEFTIEKDIVYHIAITRSKTDDVIKLYINGVLIFTTIYNIVPAGLYRIGHAGNAESINNDFCGYMNEFKISNIILYTENNFGKYHYASDSFIKYPTSYNDSDYRQFKYYPLYIIDENNKQFAYFSSNVSGGETLILYPYNKHYDTRRIISTEIIVNTFSHTLRNIIINNLILIYSTIRTIYLISNNNNILFTNYTKRNIIKLNNSFENPLFKNYTKRKVNVFDINLINDYFKPQVYVWQ